MIWFALGLTAWVAVLGVCFVANGRDAFPPRAEGYWSYFKTMTKCIVYQGQQMFFWIITLCIMELFKFLEKGMIIDFSLEQIEDPFASCHFQNPTKKCVVCGDFLFEQFRPLSGTTVRSCFNDECPKFRMGYEYEAGKEEPTRESLELISLSGKKTWFYSGPKHLSA